MAELSYVDWIARYDAPTPSGRIAMRRRLRTLLRQPRISVLLPVYNPDLTLLAAAIESVRGQSYENWELCLADDASTEPATRPFLEQLAASDRRIHITFREKNGHIAAASNSALALATGSWCALLDQDDLLAPDALAWVACEIAAHPDARLIYSDEDKIDLAGARSNPYFKGSWDPEFFLAQNYFNHLGVFETELLRGVGGFREGYDGAQDHDLVLRCSERIDAAQIRHIPRVLYHWRSAPGSVAATPAAKPYAAAAARRAIADYLARNHIAGRVEACPENAEAHRVVYEIPDPAPLVTIIIPTRDRAALLRRCLESLRSLTNYSAYEIVIVDNGSTEPEALAYFRELEAAAQARIILDAGPFNFSQLNNFAAAEARGDVLAFLNNDIEATEAGWLGELVSHAVRPGVGAVGARLWYGDDTLQHGGVILGLGGVAGHSFLRMPRGHHGYFDRAVLQRRCSAVTGACLVTRREVFAQLGGFDAENLPVDFSDIDYCLRAAEQGLATIWTPAANLLHAESISRGHHRSPADQARFFREASYMHSRHGAALLNDPFYNPNLSLQLPGYALAFSPRLA